MKRPVRHKLGFGNGVLLEFDDGTIGYQAPGGLSRPLFQIRPGDISGFTTRKATKDDQKRLDASSFHDVVTIQGLGTTLAEFPAGAGVGSKIEAWFRARPDFGPAASAPPAPAPAPPPPPPPSVPAGWYPDATNPGLQRYWDGIQWTEHTAPAGPPTT